MKLQILCKGLQEDSYYKLQSIFVSKLDFPIKNIFNSGLTK